MSLLPRCLTETVSWRNDLSEFTVSEGSILMMKARAQLSISHHQSHEDKTRGHRGSSCFLPFPFILFRPPPQRDDTHYAGGSSPLSKFSLGVSATLHPDMPHYDVTLSSVLKHSIMEEDRQLMRFRNLSSCKIHEVIKKKSSVERRDCPASGAEVSTDSALVR